MTRTVEALERLAQNINVLLAYQDPDEKVLPLERPLFEVYVDVSLLWLRSIKFMRRHFHGMLLPGLTPLRFPDLSPGAIVSSLWPADVGTEISKINEKVDDSMTYIKRLSAAQQVRRERSAGNHRHRQLRVEADVSMEIRELYNTTNRPSARRIPMGRPEVKLSCHIIDLSQNRSFVARDEIMNAIRTDLDHDLRKQPRCLALCGPEGIGKTQLALAYAYQRKTKGTQVVIWINCRTAMENGQSFTRACSGLGLEVGSHQANMMRVVEWLRITGTTTCPCHQCVCKPSMLISQCRYKLASDT